MTLDDRLYSLGGLRQGRLYRQPKFLRTMDVFDMEQGELGAGPWLPAALRLGPPNLARASRKSEHASAFRATLGIKFFPLSRAPVGRSVGCFYQSLFQLSSLRISRQGQVREGFFLLFLVEKQKRPCAHGSQLLSSLEPGDRDGTSGSGKSGRPRGAPVQQQEALCACWHTGRREGAWHLMASLSPVATVALGGWLKMDRSFFLKKRRADFVAGSLSGRVVVAGGLGKGALPGWYCGSGVGWALGTLPASGLMPKNSQHSLPPRLDFTYPHVWSFCPLTQGTLRPRGHQLGHTDDPVTQGVSTGPWGPR